MNVIILDVEKNTYMETRNVICQRDGQRLNKLMIVSMPTGTEKKNAGRD